MEALNNNDLEKLKLEALAFDLKYKVTRRSNIFIIHKPNKLLKTTAVKLSLMKESTLLTNFLLFLCQCWSCSRALLQLPLLPASGREASISIGSLEASSMDSFSLMVDNVAQSRGLHRPKSESFIWPFLSKRRLSGLISLVTCLIIMHSSANHNIEAYTKINTIFWSWWWII